MGMFLAIFKKSHFAVILQPRSSPAQFSLFGRQLSSLIHPKNSETSVSVISLV